jgi:hypothetical protein
VVLMRLQEMARLLSIYTSRVALALVRARIMVRGIGFNLTCARRSLEGLYASRRWARARYHGGKYTVNMAAPNEKRTHAYCDTKL